MPPRLARVFRLGVVNPVKHMFTVRAADLTEEDRALLLAATRSRSESAVVEIVSEHGVWTFVVSPPRMPPLSAMFVLTSTGRSRPL